MVPSLAIYEALRSPAERGIVQYRHVWDGTRLTAVGPVTDMDDWPADPALLPVWEALHPAIARNHRTVVLKGLRRETRHALSFVLARPVVGDERLEIAKLMAVVRSRACLTLGEVVLAATGRPMVTRREEKRRLREPLERLEQQHPKWLPRRSASRSCRRTTATARSRWSGSSSWGLGCAGAGGGDPRRRARAERQHPDRHALSDGSWRSSRRCRRRGGGLAGPARDLGACGGDPRCDVDDGPDALAAAGRRRPWGCSAAGGGVAGRPGATCPRGRCRVRRWRWTRRCRFSSARTRQCCRGSRRTTAGRTRWCARRAGRRWSRWTCCRRWARRSCITVTSTEWGCGSASTSWSGAASCRGG